VYVSRYDKADRLHTVGYYSPKGEWCAMSDHDSSDDAAAEIARLNGGGSGLTDDQMTDLKDLISRLILATLVPVLAEPAPAGAALDTLRAQVMTFLTAWERTRAVGFVCADQLALAESMTAIHELRVALGLTRTDSQ